MTLALADNHVIKPKVLNQIKRYSFWVSRVDGL
jgi:hypothetical protein